MHVWTLLNAYKQNYVINELWQNDLNNNAILRIHHALYNFNKSQEGVEMYRI